MIPQTVLELLGVMKLRQICYDRCSDELDKDIDYCNVTYPGLAFDQRWGECVGEALAVYYRCTEDCPPKQKIIENPFGQ